MSDDEVADLLQALRDAVARTRGPGPKVLPCGCHDVCACHPRFEDMARDRAERHPPRGDVW
jgi:hypothetical protein